jgi:hypothetical protein
MPMWDAGCPLTWRPERPLFNLPAGRTAAAARAGFAAIARGGGKSGLQGSTVAANGRRGRPQGKCHREQTAGAGQPAQARVKRCGKSAPRCRQRQRHGKPHREQDRIGAARVSGATPASSAILAAARVGCSRRGAIRAPEEWPSRRATSRQNPAYRSAGEYAGSARRSGLPAPLLRRSGLRDHLSGHSDGATTLRQRDDAGRP